MVYSWGGDSLPVERALRMALASDRRHHKRLDMTSRDCKLTLLREGRGKQQREQCTLLDLGYGGMRFRSHDRLREGETYRFLIEISGLQGEVIVKANIRWALRLESHHCDLGAMFVESSKGWLGPDENDVD
jgi:hypothetical protein